MKKTLLYLAFGFLFTFSACTEDFDEINENPTALTANDVSAKFFVITQSLVNTKLHYSVRN